MSLRMLAGMQLTISPTADSDGDGMSDVEQLLMSITEQFQSVGPTTNYEAALQESISTFNSLRTPSGNGNLVFLSDGFPNVGGSFTDEATTLRGFGVNLRAYGAGDGASLTELQKIDPDAALFHTTDELLAVFSGVGTGAVVQFTEPGLNGVTVYLDLNDNGVMDTGEPRTVTSVDNPSTPEDEAGSYTFSGLLTNRSYTVSEVVPAGYQQTQPNAAANFEYLSTLQGGDIINGLDFGNTQPLANISGTKFIDSNENGMRETPDIVLVVDGSVSALEPYECFDPVTGVTVPGSQVGDVNHDGLADTVLDAELAALLDLRQTLVNSGFGGIARISLVAMGGSSALKVPLAPGVFSVSPLDDFDNDGVSDLEEALTSFTRFDLNLGQGTNFEAALQTAQSIFRDSNTVAGEGAVVFLSDGSPTVRRHFYDDEVTALKAAGMQLRAFVMGDNPRLQDAQRLDPNAGRLCGPDFFDFSAPAAVATDSVSINDWLFAEKGQAGVTIYLDDNRNGLLDAGERSTVTLADDPNTAADETGSYVITGVAAGSHLVREVVPTGYRPTSHGTGDALGSRTVIIGSAPGGDVQDIAFVDFGNVKAAQPPVIVTSAGATRSKRGAEIAVDAGVTLTDADSPNFNGGVLEVSILSGHQSKDKFDILTSGSGTTKLSVAAGDLKLGKTVIGTVSIGSTSLRIQLTADTDQALVNRILRSISLKGNLRELGTRVLQFKATDPSRLVSNLPTKTVIFESVDAKQRQ